MTKRQLQSGFIRITKKSLIMGLIALLIFTGSGLYLLMKAKSAQASWYDDNWAYRKAISVTISSSSADITNLETLLTIDTTGITAKLQTNCEDLRFTNQSGKLLPYYIDTCSDNSATNKVWVMADLVPKNTTTYTLYMYYGNPAATSASDSTKFRLFNGLVGYWSMNESSWNGTSGEVKDSSVNGNNGVSSCTGGGCTVPSTTTAKYTNGGSFDGTQDYATMGDINAFDGLTKVTVSVWAKWSGSVGGLSAEKSLARKQGATGVFALGGGWAAGKAKFWVNDGTWKSSNDSTTRIDDGSWHHIVGIYDASTIRIYIDGVQENSNSIGTTTLSSTNDPFSIGSYNNGTNFVEFWNGIIDDTRIYNRALSADEITQLYQNPGTIASTANATVKPSTSFASEEKGPGPLAYWSFDDGTGTNAQDSTTNNNDGTVDGATWQTEDQCVSGKCLYFDGSTSYVDAGNSSNLQITSTITVGAWVKFNTIPSGATTYSIVSKNEAGGYGLIANEASNGKISTWFYINGAYRNAGENLSNLSANTWYYIVGTFDGTDTKFYRDGVLKQTVTATGTISNPNEPLTIGANPDGVAGATHSEFFKGFIDEVKIYPYARSSAQILADYNSRGGILGTSAQIGSSDQWKSLSQGLVGYWKMDETSGNATDSSGNGDTLTNTNTVTYAAGKFGNAGSFNGSTQYFTCTDANCGGSGKLDYPGTGGWSIGAWIKTSTSTKPSISYTIVSKWASSQGYELLINYQGYAQARFAGDTSVVSGTTVITDQQWHYVMAVYNSSALNIYVDGKIEGTLSSPSAPVNSTSAFWVGTRNSSYYFPGLIDEARVYNRALSSNEVSQLYNFAPGPVGYWNFEEGTGGTVNDTSGQANTGTWNGTGSPHWKSGKYGKAGNFNGSDDFVAVGDPSSEILDFGTTTDFTLSAWVKIPSAEDGDYILAKYSEGATAGYAMQVQSNHLRAFIRDGNGSGTAEIVLLEGSTNIVDNQWHYVSATFDRDGNLSILVDGKSDATPTSIATVTDTTSNSISLDIGRRASVTLDNSYITGQIDDVKIYNYARSAKQINADMTAGAGSAQIRSVSVNNPVGYWDFDEGVDNTCSGGTNDICNSGSGGSALDGANSGFASPATSTSGWTQSGKFGKALLFDGSNDYIETNAGVVMTPIGTGDFSWFTWAYINASGRDDILIWKSSDGSDDIGLYIDTNQKLNAYLKIDSSGGSTAISSKNTPVGSWVHLGMVRKSGTVSLYINGVQDGSGSSSVNFSNHNTNRLWIGSNHTNFVPLSDYDHNGTIDEVKIYNYALTADEVKTDYNHGSSQVLGTLSDNSTYQSNAANQEYCVPGDTTSCVAPVGRWDFENNVLDTSGNAYNGTWNGTGSPRYKSGKVGKAGSFNGSDDYVSAGANPITGSSAFTLQAWMKMNSHASYGLGVMIGNATSGQSAWIGWSNTAQVGTSNSIGGGFYGRNYGSGITDNNWHFVTLTFSGGTNGTALLYIDGVQKTTDTQTPSLASTIVMMGKANTGVAYWYKGFVDQVRIYAYARTPAQVAWDYNKGGPVGYWDFDECQGSTVNDLSGNSYTGTINMGSGGTTTVGTCNTASTFWGGSSGTGAGKVNYAGTFDGTDDRITTSAFSPLATAAKTTTSLSWGGWFNPTTSAASKTLMEKASEFQLTTDSSSMPICGVYYSAAFHNSAAPTSALTVGSWNHVICTYDGTNINTYLNGKLIKQSAETTAVTASSSILYLGETSGGANFYSGLMDETRIYNYALTGTQVKLLYNNGAVNFSPSTGAP